MWCTYVDLDYLRAFQASMTLRAPMCSSHCCWLGLRCLSLGGLDGAAHRYDQGVDGWRMAHLLSRRNGDRLTTMLMLWDQQQYAQCQSSNIREHLTAYARLTSTSSAWCWVAMRECSASRPGDSLPTLQRAVLCSAMASRMRWTLRAGSIAEHHV